MGDIAAHWVDHVLPDAPYRQWVLTLPYSLRYLLAFNPDAISHTLGAFLATISRWQRKRARRLGYEGAQSGALTVIQRFGSALNLNVHFHSLAPDGFFVPSARDEPTFVELPGPTSRETAQLVTAVRRAVLRRLRRAGLLPEDQQCDQPDPLALDEPALAECYGASIMGRVAFGPRKGQTVERVGGIMNLPVVEIRGNRCAAVEGFNLHADVDIDAGDRDRLENVCRYMARPAIANDRLSWRSDGRLSYRLKRPWSDGTEQVVFEPTELIEKLCALVPAPNKNLVRYHGIFAPNAHLRPLITPSEQTIDDLAPETTDTGNDSAPETTDTGNDSAPETTDTGNDSNTQNTDTTARKSRRPWAELMARVLLIDALACGQCGGRMKQISTITDPKVIRPFLDCLGIPSTPPTVHPARPPPDPEETFDW